MKTISKEEFKNRILYDIEKDFIDLSIEFEKILFLDFEKIDIKSPIFFKNVIFTGQFLKFYHELNEKKLSFHFENCTFNTNIQIKGYFDDISFVSNVFNGSNFEIINSNIGLLEFTDIETSDIKKNNTNIFNKGNFKIHDCEFNSVFWFKNVKFLENTSTNFSSVRFFENCNFEFLTVNKIMFYKCEFIKELHFDSNFISSQFRDCNFFDKTTFLGLSNIISSFLWFDNCTFLKFVDFNYYMAYKFRLEDTAFRENVSFQESYFDIITLVRTVFEKKAWFENIQIKKIDDCDIRTIRTIKQELQKAENKIDFSRFRVYEFNAYRKEIKLKLIEFKKDRNLFYHRKREPIQLKRDLFILNLSDVVSEYGTDWKRALKFTLIAGFFAFTLFFILENTNKTIYLNNYKDFMYGYFRFFLISDFKNEYFIKGESVLKFNCVLSIFPFVLGKIAVAFGLYEMIQSFRKFKA